MDFSWTPEQLALRDEVLELAGSLNDKITERDAAGEFSREAWKRCADAGFLSMAAPAAHNTTGSDTDPLTAALAVEAMGYGCRDLGLNLAMAAHMWTVQHPIAAHGTDEQKQRFLPAMTSGEMIGAHAVTEPEAGSDHHAITTHARPVKGGYALTGTKRYITLGPLADVALVFATTDPEKGRWGMIALLVETSSDGCVAGPVRDKMGLRTVPMSDLTFDECFVPVENRLGPEGAGASISGTSLGVERCFVLAGQVGAMERQVEEAIAFAKQRVQFGRPIGKFQSVSNRIADMRLALENSKLMLYKVAWMIGEDMPVTLESALLKLQLSEAFVDTSLSAILTRGGAGYLTEHEVERDLRDAIGGLIYAGTNDIQRLLVARLLGL